MRILNSKIHTFWGIRLCSRWNVSDVTQQRHEQLIINAIISSIHIEVLQQAYEETRVTQENN